MSIKQNFPSPKTFKSSLMLVATSYSLRCDAKYADSEAIALDQKIRKAGFFELGELLPRPFAKGIQHTYLDQATDESVPVINTLSIQNLTIREDDCRHISWEDFDELTNERRLAKGDVLLTVDGGVSIGKPVLFDKDEPFTVDSHVVILRPVGISALALVYLLASPLGQMQFRRAESGASGQTTVTEDDVRRFVFPRSILKTVDKLTVTIEAERQRIAKMRADLDEKEASLWKKLDSFAA